MKAFNDFKHLNLTFLLYIRQMGVIADCIRHIEKEDERCVRAWVAYIKTELADICALTRKTCALLGLDYDEVVKLGDTRDLEKSVEYLKRHPDHTWF